MLAPHPTPKLEDHSSSAVSDCLFNLFAATPLIRGHSFFFVDAEALVADTREIGLEVRADKTKYMIMSRDQNAGRIHSVRVNNSTFERVEEFKYLGRTLTNQNSIPEEIKSRLMSGNACYHSVQNLLLSGCYPKI